MLIGLATVLREKGAAVIHFSNHRRCIPIIQNKKLAGFSFFQQAFFMLVALVAIVNLQILLLQAVFFERSFGFRQTQLSSRFCQLLDDKE